ncbi:DIP1984 family protein [Candidatus Woesearchaeota archaeon]|nr:DIP1984 family protein [Candidatus Woesearchaeota archaeon]
MKLGEALSTLKKEKSRLARLILLRKENVYVEEGKKTKFDPKKLSEEINKKIEDILELKIKIQKTNINTKVTGETITLAEAIIKVNDLRSKISHLSTLFERKRDFLFRDKDEKELVPQLDELEVEDKLEKLEIDKIQLDNKIQITNWTTKLLD